MLLNVLRQEGKLLFETDNTADTMEDEISKLYGIKFVDNMHDMSMTEVSSDDEFAVDCLSVTKAQNWHFTLLRKNLTH